MSGLLAGKVVLVTGGASGIGLAGARLAAAEDARVVLTDRDRQCLERGAAGIADAIGLTADVTDAAAVEAAVAAAVERYGRLDAVLHCAGRPEPFRGLLDASEADFAALIDVNVRGTWLTMRAAAAQMRRQGSGGAIVAVASTAGLRGSPAMAIYSTTKHAVIGLVRSAALEFAATGPRINALCPGVIDTPMMQAVAADPRASRAFAAAQPNGRFGTPDEVAQAAVWLLSDRATLVTGAVMTADGGLSS